MAYVAESFPLKNGMKGTNTMALQQKLGVTADGYFGTATETALKKAYGVTSCSQELFNKITNNSNKKGMTLTESTKKKLKIGGLVVGGVGLAFGLYKLITKSAKKKALSGVRRRRTKARTRSLKGTKSLKVLNLK